MTVTAGNAPVASFVYSPTSPAENETIYFNASGSSDQDGTIVAFAWNFGDGTSASGETVTHKYGSSGSFTVILQVTDDDGNTGSTTQTISIGANDKPVVAFIFSPTSPTVDQDVHFDASDSYDADGTIVTYYWDFGDGSTGSGLTVIHRYSSKGSYSVYLRVTDNSGNTANTTKSLTVSDNQSPTAAFIYSPDKILEGDTAHFNASQSSDPDGTIEEYEWDFGDGNHGTGKEVSHTYSKFGTYQVTLVVTDNSGNSDSVTEDLKVEALPTAAFSISPVNPTTFDASASVDPDGSIVSYFWSFGEAGATATGQVVGHTYNSANTYTVSLTVTDEDGNTDTISQTVTVN